jgi:hypothetical protein
VLVEKCGLAVLPEYFKLLSHQRGEWGMTVILWDIGIRVIYSHKFGEIVHNNPYDFQEGLTLIVRIGDFHMKKHWHRLLAYGMDCVCVCMCVRVYMCVYMCVCV